MITSKLYVHKETGETTTQVPILEISKYREVTPLEQERHDNPTPKKRYETIQFDFKPRGAFFAFSDEQAKKEVQPGIEYVSLGQYIPGLHAPKDKAMDLMKAVHDHYKQESKNRLEHDGIDKIIEYELSNHECYYTGSIEDVLYLCKEFDITEEKIIEVFRKTKHLHDDR